MENCKNDFLCTLNNIFPTTLFVEILIFNQLSILDLITQEVVGMQKTNFSILEFKLGYKAWVNETKGKYFFLIPELQSCFMYFIHPSLEATFEF